MLIDCDSRITAVTVHARGALVTRRVTVPDIVPDGEIRLAVHALTPLAEPGSLRAALLSESHARSVTSVRSEVRWPESSAAPGESRAKVDGLRAQLRRVSAEHAHLVARRDQLAAMTVEPTLRPTLLGPPVDARMLDALACSEALSALLSDLDARAIALEAETEALQRQIRSAELELAQATSAQRDRGAQPSRSAVMQLHGRGPIGDIELTYAVPAARWWPIYTLRLTDNARRATWMIEALVAQLTREDWTRAKLSLSTADLLFDARMPELPSLRLGRAQSPVRKDYRAPPPGLDRMFEGYDKAFQPPPSPAQPQPMQPETTTILAALEESEEQELDGAGGEYVKSEVPMDRPAEAKKSAEFGRPLGAPAPARNAPARHAAAPEMQMRARAGSVGGGGMWQQAADVLTRAEPEAAAEAIEPSDAWLDFDALVLRGPEPGPQRGRLSHHADAHTASAREEARRRIEALVASSASDPMGSRGMFDHRYETQGNADVPSDGRLHRLTVGSAEATTAARWRTVPRETPEVFREVELKNPFSAPLLAGPVEVYSDGSLLTVASIARIDRGGTTRVGMGVDPRVRVARNARMHEETTGILGGSTVVEHTVSIELSAPPGLAPTVDVIDRVPVTDDKSAEVQLLSARPEARGYKQSERGAPVRGGLQWTVSVPAGAKSVVEFSYRVTLPSKTELVGGNRRD